MSLHSAVSTVMLCLPEGSQHDIQSCLSYITTAVTPHKSCATCWHEDKMALIYIAIRLNIALYCSQSDSKCHASATSHQHLAPEVLGSSARCIICLKPFWRQTCHTGKDIVQWFSWGPLLIGTLLKHSATAVTAVYDLAPLHWECQLVVSLQNHFKQLLHMLKCPQ